MIDVINKTDCTGCGACAKTCPQHCIKMTLDQEGFQYPTVLKDQCINCNKCEKSCPIKSKTIKSERDYVKKCYAAWSVDEAIRGKSSSGGVFYEIASSIIHNGGCVYGVSLNEVNNVKTICTASVDDLPLIMGSKYLQSPSYEVFEDAKMNLDIGKKVLFTGTPCQISGLLNYLGKQYNNLYTVAVACHGVPSQFVWSKYIQLLEGKNGASIKRVAFRNKTTGWRDYSVYVLFENGKEYSSVFTKDPFMRCFIHNLDLRPSCYKCQFRGNNCDADIILGDFWGVNLLAPNLDDNRGTSQVLIMSSRGEELFNKARSRLFVNKMNYESSVRLNHALYRNPLRLKRRDLFLQKIEEYGFLNLVERYCRPPMWKSILLDIYGLRQRFIR